MGHIIIYFLTISYQFLSQYLVHNQLVHPVGQGPVHIFPTCPKEYHEKLIKCLTHDEILSLYIYTGFPRAAGLVTLLKRERGKQPWLVLSELSLAVNQYFFS